MGSDKEADVPVWFCGTASEWRDSGLMKAAQRSYIPAVSGVAVGFLAGCAGAAASLVAAANGAAADWGAGPALSAFGMALPLGFVGAMLGETIFQPLNNKLVSLALLRIAKENGGEERLLALQKSFLAAQESWPRDDKKTVQTLYNLVQGVAKALKDMPEKERPNLLRERHANAMAALEAMRRKSPEAFAMKDQAELVESVAGGSGKASGPGFKRRGL